jgi:hypothetical protein
MRSRRKSNIISDILKSLHGGTSRGDQERHRMSRSAMIAAALAALVLGACTEAARADDVPIPSALGTTASRFVPLVVRQKTNGSASVKYSSGAGYAEITKGAGTDPGAISAEFYFMRGTEGAVASFRISAGAYDGTSGWKRNKPRVARYRNRAAPAGPTQVSRAAINLVYKRLNLAAKGLGDVPYDIDSGTDPRAR